VRKEIWTHILAYNLIRTIMAQAATSHHIEPRSISFKGGKADSGSVPAVNRLSGRPRHNIPPGNL